jgi:Cofilin/tropomyosin-type actin-binding protein.
MLPFVPPTHAPSHTLFLSQSPQQSTGVTCAPDIAETFESFKLQKAEYKGVTFITYKMNDSNSEIVIDKVGEIGQKFDDFVACLPENDCRYAAVDIHFSTNDGRDTSKLVFITWIPDTARIKAKMLYAASKKVLHSELTGIGIMINCNDYSDLDFESCIKPEVMKFV